MKAALLLAFSLVSLPALADFPSAHELQDRADDYSHLFYNGTLPSKYLDQKVTPGIGKIRELRTVIPGVLYRGGGPGGTKPLPAEALKNLCEAGFSTAIYGYTDNFSPVAPVTCTNQLTHQSNTLTYIALNANEPEAKKIAMEKVYGVIKNPAKGPVLVHCWNGWHASGELAAIGLRQFCPATWTGDKASAYWLRNANGAALISRIKKFAPFSEFSVPSELEGTLCIQKQ